MDIVVRGKTLHEALMRIHPVARQDAAPDVGLDGKVTIESSDDQIALLASNNRLRVRLLLADPCAKVKTGGRVTVSSTMLTTAITAMVGTHTGDHLVTMCGKEGHVLLEDRLSGRAYCIPGHTTHHSFGLFDPHGASFTLPTRVFCEGVRTVARYLHRSTQQHKVRYRMVFLDFCPGETRFFGGDGLRFVVLSYPQSVREADEPGRHFLPAESAKRIADIVQPCDTMDLVFSSESACYVRADDRIHISADAIPVVQYIDYEKHAFRDDQARCIIDIVRRDLQQALRHVAPLSSGSGYGDDLHSVVVDASPNVVELRQEEKDCPSSIRVPAKFCSLDGAPCLHLEYAWRHLCEVAAAEHGSHVRLKIIEPTGPAIAEVGDLHSSHDLEHDFIADLHGTKLRFFFAAILDTDKGGPPCTVNTSPDVCSGMPNARSEEHSKR